MSLTATTCSVEETRDLAAALAALARPGDLLLLCGDLGAGKTAFVQGFGVALGVEQPITSPTFTLANQYRGRLPVHHLDVYRLEQLDEVVEMGLFDLLDERSVVLIEWGDAVVPVLPPDYLRLTFTLGEEEDQRHLALDPVGARWSSRVGMLAASIDPWSGERAC